MDSTLNNLLVDWKHAIASQPWGVQRVFKDVLTLVKEEKKHDLIYSADYRDGGACLVNAAGNLLTTGGGKGIPSANFSSVVGAFDAINRELLKIDVNKDYHVSPMAAEILLHHYPELKEPTPVEQAETFGDKSERYVEPSDEQMQEYMTEMLKQDATTVKVEDPFGILSDHEIKNI